MAAVGPPPPPAGAAPPANPFTGNDLLGNPRPAGSPAPLGFNITPDPRGGPGVANLNQKLDNLKQALRQKYQETSKFGNYQADIVNNLLVIKARIQKLARLITRLSDGLRELRYNLESQMDDTLENIITDLELLQGAQVDAIVNEIGAIQTALNDIQAGIPAGSPGADEVAAANWNDPVAAVAPGAAALPDLPAAGTPPGFLAGGSKSKKGGYTYPKMRSRSRLRNNKVIQHTFKTVKPKRHHKRHPKSKRTRKHRKSKN